MSYAEHGPRIFLANKYNAGTPLIYDIRAWSPNYLENSRYFRELNENGSPIGKIIPFHVVIDNIIHLNSQAQNELQIVKEELQKYKCLKLSPKQEQQLHSFENKEEMKKRLQNDNCTTSFPLRDAFVDISKSVATINSNSCLSIHIPYKGHFQNNIKDESTLRNRSNEVCPYSLTAYDSSLNNSNLVPSFRCIKSFLTEDFSEKPLPCIKCIDVAVQVEMEMCNAGKIDSQMAKYFNKSSTKSVMSQTSFAYKYSDEDNSMTETGSSSLQTNNDKEHSFECDASCSESSQNSETTIEFCTEMQAESNLDLHQRIHKGIIIQTESKIIALEHELCVRDADLKELQDVKNDLEKSLQEKEDYIKTQQENLKLLYDRLLKLHQQHNYEIENLKQKLRDYKYLIEQLQQDLSNKYETCHLQSQEIEKLKLCVKDVAMLQLEKTSYIEKLQEMEQSVKKAKTCNLALQQIKSILQEKNELKKENYEQCHILIDQEEEINQLINEISIAYEEQRKTKDILENLKAEIHNKDIKISQYEKELLSMKQEISDFFNNLKHALNNLEELNGLCEDVYNCTNCELDINEEANNVLQNINTIMTRFQSYKIESQNLVQEIENLKRCIENNKQQIHLDQNFRNIIDEDFYYEPDINLKNTSGKDNMIVLNIKQDKSSTNEIELEEVSNSVNSKNSLCTTSHNLDIYKHKTECHNYIIKLDNKTNIDKVEKEIIEYFSQSLIKLHSLTQKLKIYVETERPFVIKLIYKLHEILEDIQSAVNISQDITLRKLRISKLYSQHKEEYVKYNSCVEEVPTDLFKIQNRINEFIEAILYQLLNEILRIEQESLHNRKINCAFEMYFKSCIDRVNKVVQGAGDQRIQIVDVIEKQQRELQEKDTEIAQLKKEIAEHLERRRGEGDCLNQQEFEKSIAIKQELSKVITELNNKNALISELKGQLQIFKNELKRKNKNLYNIKNKLWKECQQTRKRLTMKNLEIKNLYKKLHNLSKINDLNNAMENELSKMKKELSDIQLKNSIILEEQKEEIRKRNTIISQKDETIVILKNRLEKNETISSREIGEHEIVVKEKEDEIVKLQNENKLLGEKLKDNESKFIRMNQTITSLTEQRDKINIIYVVQEDLAKLDKNKEKLKVELNSLKVQLVNDQNNNKKLDTDLGIILHENEILQKYVEYWKNENSELTMKLCNKISEEKLKSQLYALSNNILQKLEILKKQCTSEENLANLQFSEHSLNKCTIHQDEIMPLTTNYINRDFKLKTNNQEREIKENEIEEVELRQLLNTANITKNINTTSCTMFKQFESSENNNRKMKYKTISFENVHYEDQNEIENSLNEIEIRDCKIRNYTETIEQLTQENMDLRAVLKSQAEYQNKLTLMKKNYDSSLKAVNERHKKNIEILQTQFEDNLKSERIFDSENWLQSLNMKELMELNERISVIINSNSNLMCAKNKNQCFYENDVHKEFYTKIDEIEEKIEMRPKNIYGREQTNTRLEKQWPLTIFNDIQNYPTLQRQDDKLSLEHSIRYRYCEEKPSELENKYEKEKQVEKDSTFDQQRWNFIKQCSAYHKLSTTYEYSRTIHTD
ncbi:uncharacterized protein LOC117609763 isoform X4 [Osmia lignaria lignaria]|uniref:uncharacterized protein LOC117609763 isoform X4 n=1 Tax=Osmia lignaria lignaria TaxID=1437193 RepID=UPI00402BD8AE